MKTCNTIIFDLDGTLLDTLEDLADAVNHALDSNGFQKRKLTEVRQFVGNGVRNLMIKATPDTIDDATFEKAFRDFKQYYGEHCLDKTRPYDGIESALKLLKANDFRMAVVSNKLDSAVKELNAKFFSEYIDVAIGDQENFKRKPAADMIDAAIRQLQAIREEAIYIGDSEVDIATAQNSGLPCISVLWGFRDKDVLERAGAKFTVSTPEEMVKAVLERKNYD